MEAPEGASAGNSVKAQEVIEYVTNKLNYNLVLSDLGWMEMNRPREHFVYMISSRRMVKPVQEKTGRNAAC